MYMPITCHFKLYNEKEPLYIEMDTLKVVNEAGLP